MAGARASDSRIYTQTWLHCTQQIRDGTPLEFFQLLVTESMLDNIVEQTNLYAFQYTNSHTITLRSGVQQWA